MRLQRFFIEQKLKDATGGEVLVADLGKVHQWLHVFRLGPGDKAILFDDSGFDYTAQFVAITPGGATLQILEARENLKTPTQELFLFQSLIKNENFELVLQKGVELGVSRFMPVLADHSEKKNLNFDRCKKIIIEASEQCGRAHLPKLYEIMRLEEAFGQYDARAVVFHPDASRFNKQEFIAERRLAVFIGPEGGWSERELELFKHKGVPVCSFSPLTLRSETAAIAISSLILL